MLIKEQNAKRKSPTAFNLNKVIALIRAAANDYLFLSTKLSIIFQLIYLLFYHQLINSLVKLSIITVNSVNLLFFYNTKKTTKGKKNIIKKDDNKREKEITKNK